MPSEVEMNAPFRVPTNTHILLMLFAGFQFTRLHRLNGIIFSNGQAHLDERTVFP
jgi:hypothetical protein